MVHSMITVQSLPAQGKTVGFPPSGSRSPRPKTCATGKKLFKRKRKRHYGHKSSFIAGSVFRIKDHNKY